jgi:alpha-beta hydrolase superfamily lysophospholipase
MIKKTFKVDSGDQNLDELHYYVWKPAAPKGWLHVIHGMSEHAQRYAPLAQYLNASGYLVTADDHRGHGQTGVSSGDLNHLGDTDSWTQMLDDQWQLICSLGRQYGMQPVVLGHSMGAAMALALGQKFSAEFRQNLQGLVLSAASYAPSVSYRIAAVIARLERARVGARKPSEVLRYLSFGSFNRFFKPARTESDWLSRDSKQVDSYIADPLCGGTLSTQSWVDFLDALTGLFSASSLRALDANKPLLLMSGDRDPVGDQGKSTSDLHRQLQKAGLKDLEIELYAVARHEIFNELNRDEVQAKLLKWLDRRILVPAS